VPLPATTPLPTTQPNPKPQAVKTPTNATPKKKRTLNLWPPNFCSSAAGVHSVLAAQSSVRPVMMQGSLGRSKRSMNCCGVMSCRHGVWWFVSGGGGGHRSKSTQVNTPSSHSPARLQNIDTIQLHARAAAADRHASSPNTHPPQSAPRCAPAASHPPTPLRSAPRCPPRSHAAATPPLSR